jgi:hypothetical protein
MAKLKISEVTVQPESTFKAPQVSALSLPLSLATDLGSGVQNITKVISEIYKDQKEKEDNSTYLDIISKISPELSTIYSEATNETDVLKGANIFREGIKQKDFLSQFPDLNRNVKDKVNTWLVKQQIELLPKLSTKITENSIKKTEVTNDNYLTQLNIKRSSATDYYSATFADKEFNTFINNPAFKKIYDAKEYDKIVKDKNLQSLRFLVDNNNKINPLLTINNAETIADIFGEKRAGLILESAKARLVSESTKTLDREKFEARASTDKQNTYFAELSTRINNANKNSNDQEAINARPDLDFIYDLRNKGAINSAQYQRLVETYTKKEILTDKQFLNELNVQIAIADTADKIDTIQDIVNADLTVMKKLGVDDLTKFNEILNSSKQDRKGFRDFQNYSKILQANMDDPQGVFKIFSSGVGDANIRATNALERYKSFVYEEKLKPEDAYLKAIEIEKNNLPKLSLVPQPDFFKAKAKDFNSNNYKDNFKTLRVDLADQYKNNKIDFKTLDKQLSQLDFIEDVADIHNKFGTVNKFFGFVEPKTEGDSKISGSNIKNRPSIIPGK